MTIAEQVFIRDDYVTIQPGEPYRLLPFGTLVKNGKRREITPELARKFRLPHFRPAIKMGSHGDETPAGGHIVGLEVREDGLWAIPEYNEKGTQAVAEGAYRYHSPEVIWEGAFEDPSTGKPIAGPLIVGDALLHMPHLGEQAALYSVEPKEIPMADTQEGTVTAPVSFFERLLGKQPEPTPEPEPQAPQAVIEYEEFAAQLEARTAEVDRLQAEINEMKAHAEQAARIQHFAAELQEGPLADDGEFHELLASMNDEQAAAIVTRLKALGAQAAAANLETDIGASGEGEGAGDPIARLHGAVQARQAKDSLSYNAAVAAIAAEQPDLFAAYERAQRS